MERKPQSFSINITVAEGNGSNTTPANSAISSAGGYIRQIIIDAPEDSATYNFRIANSSGRNIYKRTGLVGDHTEDLQTPMVAGTFTLYLENCSHNGSYSCEIIYAEVY